MLRRSWIPQLFVVAPQTSPPTAPAGASMLGRLWIPLLFLGLLVAMYLAATSSQPGTIIFPLLFVFLLTGFPIALSLAIATVIYLYYWTNIPLTAIPQTMFTNLDSFPLMAVPFF